MNEKIKNFITMTLGTLVTAAGVYFFKFPNNFSTGGVSGIAVLLAKIMPDVSTSQIVLIINVALLAVGFLFLGKGFGGKTAYCSMLLSFSLTILEKLFPMSAPLTHQPVIELVFAVLIPSFGSALLFHNNASTGGMEIIAMIFQKYTNMNMGKALLFSDALIACSTVFVFGFETGLFSILGLLSKSLIVDQVMKGLTLSKSCFIITDASCCEAVCQCITKSLHRGATIINSRGYFSGDDKCVIISVIRKNQVHELRKEIKAIDENAFLIVNDTNQAFGRGFATI